MAKRIAKTEPGARERLLDAAYDLFAAQGVNQVGIDTILAESGCAKASLYSNFESKVDLAVACLGGWYYGYPLHLMPLSDWKRLLEDNLTTHFLFMQSMLP